MKEKVLEKLAEWMKPLAIPAGEYRGRSYNYILPLRPYVKGKDAMLLPNHWLSMTF